ncbi:hypothetical protein [Streptomyces sp. NPDC002994]|uniref:hypothetical protein n=1 Tax=Streptomyces sp. NPDC002994 TaxID=3154441 RepID=UPI00339E5B32
MSESSAEAEAKKLIREYVDELREAGGNEAFYSGNDEKCKLLQKKLDEHHVAPQPNAATFLPLMLEFWWRGCKREVPRFPKDVNPRSVEFYMYPSGTFQGWLPGLRKWNSSSFYLGEGAYWDGPQHVRVPDGATICARDQNNNESSPHFQALGTPVKFKLEDIEVHHLDPSSEVKTTLFSLKATNSEMAERYLRPHGVVYSGGGSVPEDDTARDICFASESANFKWSLLAEGASYRFMAWQRCRLGATTREYVVPVGLLSSSKENWDRVSCITHDSDHSRWEVHDFAGGGWK